jgi:hypothetical protein
LPKQQDDLPFANGEILQPQIRRDGRRAVHLVACRLVRALPPQTRALDLASGLARVIWQHICKTPATSATARSSAISHWLRREVR